MDNVAASILSSGTEPPRSKYKHSRFVRWWSWRMLLLKQQVGRFLNWLHVPGFIRPMEMYDELITHSLLEVRVTPLFTIISVDGRDYYFYRISGKFDGTGMSVSCPASANPLDACGFGQASE